MAFSVIAGQTDYTTLIRIVDSTGQPIAGLVYTDIALNYTRVETDNDVTEDAASPASLSALTDAHTDWGFKEVNATEAPGVYRLDIGDAALATGAWSAVVTLVDAGANDITPVSLLFDLTAVPANVTQVASVAVSGSTPDVNVASIASEVIAEVIVAMLKQDFTGITGEATASMLNAMRKLTNKIAKSGSTLHIKKEDGTTDAFTQTITTDAAALPITGLATD